MSFLGLTGKWTGSIAVVLFAVIPCMQAEETAPDDFSDPAAINLRIQQVQSESGQASASSDPVTTELLKNLESAIFQHKATVELLPEFQRKRDAAVNAVRNWKGFEKPGPYSIQFADELRMNLASVQGLQEATAARSRIIARSLEAARHASGACKAWLRGGID